MQPSPSILFALLGVAYFVQGECPSCKGGSWTPLAPIPIGPRQEHATFAISRDTIGILGGIIPEQGGDSTTAIVQLYDIPSNTWRPVADAPFAVNHPNVAVVNGKVYLLGGLAVAPDGVWRAVPDSWVYDYVVDEWTPLEPIPKGLERGSAGMGVYGDRIYLAGGMTELDIMHNYQNSITSVISPRPRRAAVINSTFYVLGGRFFGQHNYRDTVFALDLDHPQTGWRTSAARMPTARGGVAAGTIGHRVYVFGGEGNPAAGSRGVFNETESFDAREERWERLRPMTVPRHGTAAAEAGGRIYIPGGGIRESSGPVDYMDVFCV
ncbi:hypothetical protein G7046_g8804 [Stylonectria norvegica]|nr:hypothetical protein G7046_g8804 [Stylonectria norvegica]